MNLCEGETENNKDYMNFFWRSFEIFIEGTGRLFFRENKNLAFNHPWIKSSQ